MFDKGQSALPVIHFLPVQPLAPLACDRLDFDAAPLNVVDLPDEISVAVAEACAS